MTDDGIKLTYLGQHYYEGNESFCYVYVDEEGKGFYIYTHDENTDFEYVIEYEGHYATFQCGVALDSIDLNEDKNVIDYGYLTK